MDCPPLPGFGGVAGGWVVTTLRCLALVGKVVSVICTAKCCLIR